MPGEKDALIQINKVSKHYLMGGEWVKALDDVSLRIQRGDFLSIVGPSGSGKSTLMNVLGCLDTPTSGQYLLDGEEISGLNDHLLAEIRNRKIGFIFQSYNLLNRLSALENVELPLIYRGLPARKRRELAADALAKVGLQEKLYNKPMELSGGQQQRLAIARALAGDPPILLADEPTGALDSRTGKEVMSLIHNLNEAGHTIILITHDQEISRQAGRIVKISDGRLTEEGA
ncbi:ABC transporter related protein [Paenibacillus algicola]|uniref:ABC transporter related protein n=1 Tax=Paenibacillus algicola TaxID=2565926 RepID=A0A4P8XP47_9BACL|nr:ABC transporter ATP-binding protein [Paenibacillus algicola]QCT03540.1 ABC transporter related protein [Paenibacillus algicola]